jgi:glycosyltransferase involved in cell wall biosynthesis
MPYGGCTLSTAATVRLIRRERPDIVHLQCVNEHFVNVYALVRWLRERQIRTVLTLHADFMFTANCGSALGCEGWRDGCRACHDVKRATKSLILNRTAKSYEKLRAAFNGFGNNLSVVSVSPWLTERASSSPMLGGFRHLTITNGVDVDVFHPIKPEDISQLCDIGNRKVVLHVTAQFADVPGHLKGGSYVFELARRMKDDSVTFVVIGPSRTSSAIPKNVQMIGELSDINELARWYNVASCTLLTSKQETFSLVCAESLCCGTPVVGFQAGGPESVACPEGSSFVPFGDMDALEACVRDAVVGKRLQRAAVAERARSMYANDTMVKKYEEEYGRMLCR